LSCQCALHVIEKPEVGKWPSQDDKPDWHSSNDIFAEKMIRSLWAVNATVVKVYI
jgi:hypothetical protein